MSSPNRSGLPDGAFITTFNGKRCTAIPKGGAKTRSNNQQRQSSTSSSFSTSTSTSTSTSSSTIRQTPPPPQQTSAPPVAPPPPPPPPPPPQTTTPPPLALITSSTRTTSSSLPPPPAPPPPPVTTPPPVAQPLPQTQAPPAPVVSDPPLPPPVLSSSSTPPLIDAEPPRTIPTFQQIPSMPPLSAPLPAQLPPPVSSSSSSSPPPNLPLPAPGTSQTDANAVPTPPAQTPPAFLSDVSPSPSSTSNAGAVAPSVGLNPGTAAGEAGNNGNNAPASSLPSSGGDRTGGVGTPVVIASSVVGAVAVFGLFGFLLWFWRKRWLRKRRSTLLTPLSTDPSFRTGEKPYVIDRESLGPTPRSAKLRAALGYNFKRFRSQVGGFVSRNRDSTSTGGRSQFMNISQHSRNSSSLSNHGGPRDAVTTKDRLKDWWERLTADMKFNWRLRGDSANEKDPFASTRDMKDRKAAMGGQPDFLTLLGMDEWEVEREAQRRRLSRGNGSAGSADHFLGGLGLNFDGASANPFSDINALPHDSAKPAPLIAANTNSNPTTNATATSNNPFSDANAISAPAAAVKPPTTYVADVRRSRGTSLGGSTTRPPSGSTYSPRLDSMYRDSMQSVESFSTRRNKFRSDPFDLERPELLGNRSTPASSNYSQAGGVTPRVPGSAHTRADSFSSKYSSGVSMDGWSDPGPDVGPASGSGPSYRYEAESPIAGYRPGEQRKPGRRPSQGSQNSVGKAL